MEKIVQLRDYEYENLTKKADLNEQQIEAYCRNLWLKEGVAEITFKMEYKRDSDDFISIDTSSSCFYREERFEIPYDLRRRIEGILDRMVRNRVEALVGDTFKLRNKVQKDVNKTLRLRWVFYAICFSGWGAFVGCLLYLLLS